MPTRETAAKPLRAIGLPSGPRGSPDIALSKSPSKPCPSSVRRVVYEPRTVCSRRKSAMVGAFGPNSSASSSKEDGGCALGNTLPWRQVSASFAFDRRLPVWPPILSRATRAPSRFLGRAWLLLPAGAPKYPGRKQRWRISEKKKKNNKTKIE